MSLLRLLSTFAICAGLLLPSAHSIAVCLDGEGNFTLEAAVNGACAGSGSHCREDEAQRGSENGIESYSAGHCGGCRDVVIGGAGVGSPIPTHEKARRTSQPNTSTPSVVQEELSTGSTPGVRTRQAFLTRIAERSSPRTISVLRL